MRVAIVGAGMTGCMLANMLKTDPSIDITLFEKSRGCGGRASSKSLDWGVFDLGAAIIPAKAPEFVDFMQEAVEQDLATKWPAVLYSYTEGAMVPYTSDRQHYVFDHKMNAVCREWIDKVELRTGCLVTQLNYDQKAGWRLRIDSDWLDEQFDKVVITCPWPQAQALLHIEGVELALNNYQQQWTSCWAVALKVEPLVATDIDFLYLKNQSIQTLIRDSAKPGRTVSSSEGGVGSHEIWVAHLNHRLSDELGKLAKEVAVEQVKQNFCALWNIPEPAISASYAHYWRFARPSSTQLPLGIVSQPQLGLWATGDWSFGASIEASYHAAKAVKQALLNKEAI